MTVESPVIIELFEECESQATNPPSVHGEPDVYVAMFAGALVTSLEQSAEAQLDISLAIADKRTRSPFSSNLAFNSLLRLFQMQHLEEVIYPYDDAKIWHQRLRELFNNEVQRKLLAVALSIWNVGSDVETRIAGPALVAHALLPERIDDPESPFKILNIGSARDHGLAMLTGVIPLPEVDVHPDTTVSDPALYKTAINRMLGKHIELGDCYGVDLWPLRDAWWSQYLEACRFYPLELKDLEKRQRYRRLEVIRDADTRLHHTDADFGELDNVPDPPNGFHDGIGANERYDMIIFSTCLYQNYPDKQKRMFDNALVRLSPGGMIVVQDFCEPVEQASASHPMDKVSFIEPGADMFSYTTLVYDPQKPEEGLLPFAHWNNGRCEVVKPAPVLQKLLDDAT